LILHGQLCSGRLVGFVGVLRFVLGFGLSLGGLVDIEILEFGIEIVELHILVLVT
jgi:hypothetical protein